VRRDGHGHARSRTTRARHRTLGSAFGCRSMRRWDCLSQPPAAVTLRRASSTRERPDPCRAGHQRRHECWQAVPGRPPTVIRRDGEGAELVSVTGRRGVTGGAQDTTRPAARQRGKVARMGRRAGESRMVKTDACTAISAAAYRATDHIRHWHCCRALQAIHNDSSLCLLMDRKNFHTLNSVLAPAAALVALV
jgi:hypothetical protein